MTELNKLIEEISYIVESFTIGEMPTISFNNTFKPGVGDKLIFIKIISQLPTTRSYPKSSEIIRNFYYPYYAWWDQKELEEAKCST